MSRSLLEAIATLTGTTIGAGILALPYVVQKAGFLTGLLDFFIIGLSILFINLAMGEVALRTKENHQLTGYANKYLGKKGKLIALLVMIFGIYGALTAYIIGEGKALAALFGGNELLYSFLFFLIASSIVFIGIRIVKKFELVLASVSVLLIMLIIAMSIGKVNLDNLEQFDIKNLLIPYGVIFFAFLAIPAIPEMKEELSRNKKDLKKAIIIGTSIPFIAYILFTFAIIGAAGLNTSEIATLNLEKAINNKVAVFFGFLLPIFSMSTAFLSLALALKEMYMYDLRLNKNVALILTVLVPLIVVLLGVTDFIKILSVVGALVAGVDGFLVIAIWRKAKKHGNRKPEYSVNLNKVLMLLIILVFILAIAKVMLNF
ncbi:MAG: aromatic amino acid transport family protein [Nanoarchaeota archaeon]